MFMSISSQIRASVPVRRSLCVWYVCVCVCVSTCIMWEWKGIDHSQYDLLELNDVAVRVEPPQSLDLSQVVHLLNPGGHTRMMVRKTALLWKRNPLISVDYLNIYSMDSRVIFLLHLLAGIELTIHHALTLEHLRECALSHTACYPVIWKCKQVILTFL